MLFISKLLNNIQNACRSAHILLNGNIRNDDVVAEQKSTNFVVFADNKMSVLWHFFRDCE